MTADGRLCCGFLSSTETICGTTDDVDPYLKQHSDFNFDCETLFLRFVTKLSLRAPHLPL